ncbi:DNA (Cytosine-5)-methyltransferase DRM1/2 isoform 2 [Hibiscus syriacus]|uniref:DNA (Cytosine-5)-methyltransferase DRM1/2 isoform 2 n=1 Tax=Hibiscus syriacus TaxID=106335 RepID=A0A6A2ZVK9_HIBSY|nr:DNA (Cytosine-5)-methyltransferase DRM1/2 isoform 2 [Hibiscus syriacus]
MQHVDSDNNSSDYEAIFQDDFTDIDNSSDIEEILNSDSDEENKLLYLTKMGFSEAEASIAMERCGPDSSIAKLTDFICAAQMTKAADALLLITQRTLREDAIGSPYFYYENVALAPVNVWTGISQSSRLTEMICKALEAYDDELPSSVQKYVLDECRKWNLVWVERNKVVPLEPDEVEMLLDVAFYCLGIPLKTDVQELNDDRLEQLMSRFGGFDLVVDGIQRNNLTGRNKHHQDEIEDFC